MVVLKAAEILINIEVSHMLSYVRIYKHVQMPPSSALNKQTNNINKSQSKYELHATLEVSLLCYHSY